MQVKKFNRQDEENLLNWYDQKKRQLPWRSTPVNPYYVLLSEFMLQQTTVVTVIPYFVRFINRFPTLESLSKGSLDEVLTLWQGLGYYRRARHLHQCAQQIMSSFQGKLPNNHKELIQLPGIGPYTTGALLSIIYDTPMLAVDGNLIRVLSRYMGLELEVNALKKELHNFQPSLRPGDFNQALMDVGATICKPMQPTCSTCPLEQNCCARINNTIKMFPVLAPKKEKPTKRGAAFLFYKKNPNKIIHSGTLFPSFDHFIFLEKRTNAGLFKDMMGLITTNWEEEKLWQTDNGDRFLSIHHIINESQNIGTITHIFTHFKLFLDIYTIECDETDCLPFEGQWISISQLPHFAVPTLMKKAIHLVLKNLHVQ